MLTKKCIVCGKTFTKPINCSLNDWFGGIGTRRPNGTRLCSKVCSNSFKKGKHYSIQTEFSKERHYIPPTAIKKGQRLSPKTEFKKFQIPHNWKGDNVGYGSLHAWVRRHKVKIKKCQHCGVGVKNKKLTWANINHKYRRNLDDYIPLCYSCHKKYDIKHN